LRVAAASRRSSSELAVADDEVVGTGLERLGVADLVGAAGHHDDVHGGSERALELPGDVEAMGPGHLQIDDREIGRRLLGLGQRPRAIVWVTTW
jgi:hypothetical protein